MRHLALVTLVSLLPACDTTGLPSGSGLDAGGDAASSDAASGDAASGDGASGDGASGDAPAGSCADLAASVKSWIDSHQKCAVDSDCTVVTTACGLTGTCGAFINLAGDSPALRDLVKRWDGGRCGGAGCVCPGFFPQPG